MRLENYNECKKDCEKVMELMAKTDKAGRETEEEDEEEEDEEEEEEEVKSVPVTGSLLHSQVMTRVTARLAECNKHLGLVSEAV